MKGLLLTYLLAYGGAVVTLFNPFYGLLIYICFAIVKPEAMWFWAVPEGNYSRVIAIAMLIGWAASGFGNWNFGRAKGIVVCLVGFWIWALVSTLVAAQDQARAFAFLESTGKIVLPFLVGITTIQTRQQLMMLAWTIMLSQAYTAYEFNIHYYSGWNRLYFNTYGGMDNNCLAIAMVTGTGLAFFLGMGASRWWQKALCVVSAILMIHCVMFAFSRGGMVALCISSVVSFMLLPKRLVHYLVFAAVVLVALRLAGPEVRERFFMTFADKTERDASAQSRLDLWRNALDTMSQSPIVGVGPDQWGHYAPRYGWTVGKRIHSLWLQTGAELGVPGMGLLLGFYGLAIARLIPLTRQREATSSTSYADFARMVVASLVGFLVAAQFVSLTHLEIPYYVCLLGAATLRCREFAADVEDVSPATVGYAFSPSV